MFAFPLLHDGTILRPRSFMQKKIFLLFGYVNALSTAFFYNFYYPRQKLPQVIFIHLEGFSLPAFSEHNKFSAMANNLMADGELIE